MGSEQMQKLPTTVASSQPTLQAKRDKQAGIVKFFREKCHPELKNVSFSERHYPGPNEPPDSKSNKPLFVYPTVAHWQEERGAIGKFRDFIDLQGCVRQDLLNGGDADEILKKLEAAKSRAEKLLDEPSSKLTPVFIERGYIPVGILIFEKAE